MATFDLFNNPLGGNSVGRFPYSVETRNSFIATNQALLPTRDPSQVLVSVVNKSFDMTTQVLNKTNDLFTNLSSKLDNVFDKLKNNTKAENPIAKQNQNEHALQNANLFNAMRGYFSKQLDLTKQTIDKLGLLDNLKQAGKNLNMSPAMMAVLAILVLKNLGLGNIKTIFQDFSNGINLFKSGSNLFKALSPKMLNAVNSLGSKGYSALKWLSNKGVSSLGKLVDKGLPFLKTLSSKGLGFLESFSVKSMPYIKKFSELGGSLLTKLVNKVSPVMETLGKVGRSTANLLKMSLGGIGKFMVMLVEGLSKVPILGKVFSIAKFAGSKTAQSLLSGFDFAVGVSDVETIAGTKNASLAQKTGAGVANTVAGFSNSFIDASNYLFGTKIPTVNAKGLYNFATGSDNQHIGKDLQSKGIIDQAKGVYDYFSGTTPTGATVNKQLNGGKRHGKPVDSISTSSPPGWRIHPIYGTRKFHKGTDIPMAIGTKVYSTHAGRVNVLSDPKGYGLYVTVTAKDGMYTLYAHLSQVFVHNGQLVNEGDLIALSGNSGGSTGAHLHYELISSSGQVLNPFGGQQASIPKDNLKPVYTAGSGSAGSGASSGAGESSTPKLIQTSGLKSSVIDKAWQGIVKNEGVGSDYAKLSKDNLGYTFGQSQFNSFTNPQAWKSLGFSDSQIKAINSGKFDKNEVQKYLHQHAGKIKALDQTNKQHLFSEAMSFAKQNNLDVSNPIVLGQLMDIVNQYGSLGKDTAGKLKSLSHGNAITLNAIKDWRLHTLWGKGHTQDQMTRFNNINSAFTGFTNAALPSTIPMKPVVQTATTSKGVNVVINLPQMLGSQNTTQYSSMNQGQVNYGIAKTMSAVDKHLNDHAITFDYGNLDHVSTVHTKTRLQKLKDVAVNSAINTGISLAKTLVKTSPKNMVNTLLNSTGIAGKLTKDVTNVFKDKKNLLTLGSDIYTNHNSILALANTGLNLIGSDNLPKDIIPSNILQTASVLDKNKGAFTDVGNTVKQVFANPKDPMNILKIGMSLFQNKDKISESLGGVANLFNPTQTSQVLEPVNTDLYKPKPKEESKTVNPAFIPLPMQEASKSFTINKSKNIDDMFLMTIVSGVFD